MTALAASAFVWALILVPLLVIWVVGLVDIVRRDFSPRATFGWILIVVLLPFVGTLVYFLTRKPTEEEVRDAQAVASDARLADRRREVGPRPPVD
ncbi:MAG: PLD nuclease N-terminal domain-containing protein [Nocardioidaceae bacterium]